VSKAFTKEDEGAVAPHLPPRAPLPKGVPNYVTASGRVKLTNELREVQDGLAKLTTEPFLEGQTRDGRSRALTVLNHRRELLEERIGTAVVVNLNAGQDAHEVRFGAWVGVRASEEPGAAVRRFRIVGVDEADAAHGLIAFVSPLANALLGRRVGETAWARTPRGEEAWEIVEVSYEDH